MLLYCQAMFLSCLLKCILYNIQWLKVIFSNVSNIYIYIGVGDIFDRLMLNEEILLEDVLETFLKFRCIAVANEFIVLWCNLLLILPILKNRLQLLVFLLLLNLLMLNLLLVVCYVLDILRPWWYNRCWLFQLLCWFY